MRLIDLLHRWTGGIIGLVLAAIGLSGAILVHRDAWIALPHAGDALVRDPSAIAAATARIMASGEVRSITFADAHFGLHLLSLAHGAGAYADQAGAIVARWPGQSHRPELWLRDLHYRLLADDVGATIAGIAGLCAILFTVTGAILWWRTRRTFRLRLLPKRLSRPAIVMHHRDLGIVVAPLILFAGLTGAMMTFRPFAAFVLAPFGSPSAFYSSFPAPKTKSGALDPKLDWGAVVRTAQARFPDAAIRTLSRPRKPGSPIAIRMHRPFEWIPNGRTMVWIDPASGRLIDARDAAGMARSGWIYSLAYPVHAAKVGGLAWRLVMTVAGLALALLGSLAVWSFWFKRPKPRRT